MLKTDPDLCRIDPFFFCICTPTCELTTPILPLVVNSPISQPLSTRVCRAIRAPPCSIRTLRSQHYSTTVSPLVPCQSESASGRAVPVSLSLPIGADASLLAGRIRDSRGGQRDIWPPGPYLIAHLLQAHQSSDPLRLVQILPLHSRALHCQSQ